MNHNRLLTIASMLSILLVIVHMADDVARGYARGDTRTFIIVGVVMVVLLCGTLLLSERRSGLVIMLLGGIVAAGMPIIHSTGAPVGSPGTKASGAFFFIFTLLALGVTGTFTVILAARGLWTLRSRKAKAI